MSFLHLLQRESRSDYDCTEVNEWCPVEDSIYGYVPNLPATIICLALFTLLGTMHVVQGAIYRTWSFMTFMLVGCLCEAAGQIGRLMLHNNVYNDAGFKLQICFLTFAPAFLAAGIYLSLKHIVIIFGPELSRIQPAWYTYIFISCDFLSLALQGAGGGLASAADSSTSSGRKLLDAGNNVMMTGLSFQVFTLLVFALLAGEYFLRVWKNQDQSKVNQETESLRRSLRFRCFLAALAIAFTAILFRCIYRIVEMAGGWGNTIMKDEITFLVLDPIMCIIAIAALNAFHPGPCFNYRRLIKGGSKFDSGSSTDSTEKGILGMSEGH